MTQFLGPLCSALSSLACFLAAVILLTFKRKSKVLFRLEIGLCIALGTAHLANFFISLPHFLNPKLLSYEIFYGTRVVTLGATTHYLVAIFITFLLNTLRWTEERMSKAETRLHIMAWLLSIINLVVYIEEYTVQKISAKEELFLSLSFLCAEASFIIVCSIAVNMKIRQIFDENSELLSPLVTARSRKSLDSFLRRLSVLTVVSCLVFLQVLLFIPEIQSQVNSVMHTEYVSELLLLDGLLVSLILTTTPGLIAQYKTAYLQWRSSYDPIPVSPYVNLENSKYGKIDPLVLSTKRISVRV